MDQAQVTVRHPAEGIRDREREADRLVLCLTKAGRCLVPADAETRFQQFRLRDRYEIVNVSQLERFEEGTVVGVEQLSDAGLVRGRSAKVKILGDGELTKKLQVSAHKFSKAAEQKIVACGGTAKVINGNQAAVKG